MIDLDTIKILSTVISGVLVWIGFMEKRMSNLRNDIKEKLEDRDKVNQVIQAALKEDIARIESKLDTLVVLLINIGKIHNGGTTSKRTDD